MLTWWQGSTNNPAFGAFGVGIGQGEDVVMNDHYQIIRTIPTTPDFTPASHEFYITPDGNALITGYRTVPNVDPSSVGGSRDGTVIDSIAREVNLETGAVLLDWSALAHVPITASYALPLFGSSPWDFFHINSISPAPDGNLLISARHMWALYDINPRSGDIVWTLGGKQSSFTVPANATFAWQHDPASPPATRSGCSTTRPVSRSRRMCSSPGRSGCTSTTRRTASHSCARSSSRAASRRRRRRVARSHCRTATWS